MIRKCVSIVLMLAISTNVVQFAIPVSWYLANYHYISTELCINKLHPEMECNGMCQLKKRLKHDSDSHDHQKEHSKNIVDRNVRIDLFITEKKLQVPLSYLKSNQRFPVMHEAYSNWISEPISPPPKYV